MSKLKKHKLKIWPEYFKAVKKGTKLYEIRKADRDFRVGDLLTLCEWSPKKETYTGNIIERKIGHVLPGGEFGIAEGYVVLSFDLKDLIKQGRPTKANLEKRKQEFVNLLKPFVDAGTYDKDMVNAFYSYWSEHGVNDYKMRFEKRESFDITRRLATWYRKSNENGNTPKQTGKFTR